jgi:hypothetical protein
MAWPGLFGLAGEASRSGGAQAAPCALSQENKLLEGRPVPGSGISVALPLSLSAAPAAERTFLYNHRKASLFKSLTRNKNFSVL